ncbi:g12927 [Coccomyxa viridis]|uniref:Protein DETOXIFICATION n=1 Tax=Coccomyxa viridis TaxID=1274662 RepID=A0ABP1GFP1_9CHLO
MCSRQSSLRSFAPRPAGAHPHARVSVQCNSALSSLERTRSTQQRGSPQGLWQTSHSVRQSGGPRRAAAGKGEEALPERYVPQPAEEGGSQGIAIPGLGGEMDAEILSLLVPATLAVFLDPAMALIDTVIVGRLGMHQLGAVGLSNMVFFFVTVFFSFLLVVTTPRVADALAVDDRARASLATVHNLWIALVIGGLLTAFLWFNAPLLIQGFKPTALVAAEAVKHLRVRSLACPAALFLFVANGAFRGARDTKTPLAAGVAQNFVNLSLDILLVVALGVGVSGAASAATAAQYTGAAVMLVMLARKDLLLPRDLPSLPPLQQWVDTLRPGIPFAFCIAAVVTALLTATNLATALGPVSLAAHTIVKQIIDFAMAIFGCFSTVAQSLVATCLGKGQKTEARQYVKRLLQMGSGSGILIAAVILLGRGWLPQLFSPDPDVIAAAARALPIVAASMPLAPCALSLEGTVLGASQITWVGGRTVLSAIVALSFFSLVSSQGWALPGIWAGMVLLVFCNGLLDAWLLLSKRSPLAME